MPTVSIDGKTDKYEVKEGAVLFDALDDQGLELPHGCLAGSCGACRLIITEGKENLSEASPIEQNTIDAIKVNYQRIHGPDYLQNEELRLSCRAKIKGDITIKLID